MQLAPTVTEDEYLAFEEGANSKHEFVNGQVIAMAGARARHNLVASNVTAALSTGLRDGPCVVLTSDQRVNVAKTQAYLYPDVTVLCGAAVFSEKSDMALTNPTLVVEVLSQGTAAYDRGPKLQHYQRLEALKEIVLVDPETRTVEVHARDARGAWQTSTRADGEVALTSVGVAFPVAALWAKLELLAE